MVPLVEQALRVEELLRGELTINEHAADKSIDRRNRRSLGRGEDAAVDTAEDDNRVDQRPLCVPDDGQPLFGGIAPVIALPAHLLAVEVAQEAEAEADEDAGQEPRHEHTGDRCRGGDAIDDHGDTGRDDNADTARAGDTGQGKALAVAFFQHGGHNHRADRRDRRRAGAADSGKEHADHNRDDRETARDVPEIGAADVQYSFGDATGSHQFTREDEQRDRHDRERVRAGNQLLHHEAAGEARIGEDHAEGGQSDGNADRNVQDQKYYKGNKQNNRSLTHPSYSSPFLMQRIR